MNMALTLALAGNQISVSTTAGATARVINNEDYTLSIEVDPAAGDITLTVMADGSHLGTFVLAQAEYSAQTHNLIPPLISGSGNTGEVLTVAPGLWLIDPDHATGPTYQWLRDGISIAGETGVSYTIQPADAGRVISCEETVGPGSVTSAGRAIVNNLIDVAASPNSVLRATTSPLPNGTLVTQTLANTARAGWDTLEDLVTGTTYRLRGTVDIPGALERDGSLIISGIGPASGDVLLSATLVVGTNIIDTQFDTIHATQEYRMNFYIEQTAGVGASYAVTDFILEVL